MTYTGMAILLFCFTPVIYGVVLLAIINSEKPKQVPSELATEAKKLANAICSVGVNLGSSDDYDPLAATKRVLRECAEQLAQRDKGAESE